MAGLSKITTDVDYFTYAYVQDESAVAQAAFHALGSPGRYHVVPDGSALVSEPIGSLVYRTDGLVNYFSTRVCTADLLALRSIVPGIGARFCGLGGNDFMRHPLRFYRYSIMYGFRHGLYSQLSLQEAASIVRMPTAILDGHIEAYLATWPEKKPNDQLKHLYNEYQNHLVNVAAEDRERCVFWTVQPMWSNRFFRAVANRLPLEWTGFRYYVNYLKMIDQRSLNAPIFGSSVVLTDDRSVQWQDTRTALRVFRKNLLSSLPGINGLVRAVRSAVTRRSHIPPWRWQ